MNLLLFVCLYKLLWHSKFVNLLEFSRHLSVSFSILDFNSVVLTIFCKVTVGEAMDMI